MINPGRTESYKNGTVFRSKRRQAFLKLLVLELILIYLWLICLIFDRWYCNISWGSQRLGICLIDAISRKIQVYFIIFIQAKHTYRLWDITRQDYASSQVYRRDLGCWAKIDRNFSGSVQLNFERRAKFLEFTGISALKLSILSPMIFEHNLNPIAAQYQSLGSVFLWHFRSNKYIWRRKILSEDIWKK